MFGYQQAGNRNQVYFDADSGRYYTQNTSPYSAYGVGFGFRQPKKNYLDESPFNRNQSQIQQMLANRQPYQYNAPTAAQMFGGVSAPQSGMFSGMGMPAMGQGMNMGGQGLFGAGRFLGGQGLLGNSTSTTGV